MLIRILHIVTKMDAAGIETLLMNFYRNIDRTKVQFDFLTHRSEKGFYDDEISELGGRIYTVPAINPFKHQQYLNSLDEFFDNHREYKIVHSHINTYSMYPLRAAMKAGVPIRIAHSHIANVPFDLKTPFRIYTKSKLTKYSTHNFACSEMAGLWLFGREIASNGTFKVINNSIDASKYVYNEVTQKNIRKQMDIEGKFVIGHIGRFSKQKNHFFLVDIFHEIYKKDPNSVLVLIGEGPLQSSIEKKIEELKLKESVIFTGVSTNVNELLQVMDVFVFPSRFEGLGIVAVEAQAAGVPCIVSEYIPEEAFITNIIEKISLSKSPNEWANAILKLGNHKKKNTLQEINKAKFDIAEQKNELEYFYLNSLKELI
ncbi:glycosyltransferase family 1 protein [Psychrobacillus sp. FSL H8-0487]|uniref:glycosyltransferase family 1 protein n=1 Tax=Psychrobacillus sp. FSL H8-0487 TaxID=2921391 RepID=UPI0030F78F90